MFILVLFTGGWFQSLHSFFKKKKEKVKVKWSPATNSSALVGDPAGQEEAPSTAAC